MKLGLVTILLLAVLLAGCATERGTGEQANDSVCNVSNATSGNTTSDALQGNATSNATFPTNNASASGYANFTASSFKFRYPANMEVEKSVIGYNGIFLGKHQLAERTGEVLAVSYVNVSDAYGPNRDGIYQANPDIAAGGLLEMDLLNDSMGFLDNAAEVGQASNFAQGRDAFISEAPFSMKLSSGTTYHGYAMSIYVPARSLHVNVRMLALNPDVAKQIRDEFLLSFRVE
jgi:predicted small secreted protein